MNLGMTDKIDGEDVLKTVIEAMKNGTLRYSDHALERMGERLITVAEVEEIIKYGEREEALDEFESKGSYWRYVIRNRDVDERDLAISVDIEDAPDAVIVTVMQIDPITARNI